MDRWQRDLPDASGFPRRPEHLSRAFKTATAFGQVSWLRHRFRLAMNFTVARPRGIHTRFPILPASMRGTRTQFQKSESLTRRKIALGQDTCQTRAWTAVSCSAFLRVSVSSLCLGGENTKRTPTTEAQSFSQRHGAKCNSAALRKTSDFA